MSMMLCLNLYGCLPVCVYGNLIVFVMQYILCVCVCLILWKKVKNILEGIRK